MNRPDADDELLRRYNEASALDNSGPSPALREAVLKQARAAVPPRTPAEATTAQGDRPELIASRGHSTLGATSNVPQKEAPGPAAAPREANDAFWRLRAVAGVAVIGLATLLFLQFERGSPDERELTHGTPRITQAPAPTPAPSPAPQAKSPAADGSPSAAAPEGHAPPTETASPAPSTAPAVKAMPPAATNATRPLRDRSDAAQAPAARSAAPAKPAGPAAPDPAAEVAAPAPSPTPAAPVPAGTPLGAPVPSSPARRLIDAAVAGQLDAARQALADGAPVDATNATGQTALMLAARRGDEALVRLLLAAGADRARTDPSGRTAAALARQQGHAALAPLLSAPESALPTAR